MNTLILCSGVKTIDRILKLALLFMRDAMDEWSLPAYFDLHNNASSGLSQEKRTQLANRFDHSKAKPRKCVMEKKNLSQAKSSLSMVLILK